MAESWRKPPQSLRLALSKPLQTSQGKTEVTSLEDDIRELRVLEGELEALQSLIAEKKRQIHSHLRQDAQNLSQQLGECDGISCIFKTIARKAHGAWDIAYFHFKPNHQPKKMDSPEALFAKAHGQAAQVAHVSGDHMRIETPTPLVFEAKAVRVPPLTS